MCKLWWFKIVNLQALNMKKIWTNIPFMNRYRKWWKQFIQFRFECYSINFTKKLQIVFFPAKNFTGYGAVNLYVFSLTMHCSKTKTLSYKSSVYSIFFWMKLKEFCLHKITMLHEIIRVFLAVNFTENYSNKEGKGCKCIYPILRYRKNLDIIN